MSARLRHRWKRCLHAALLAALALCLVLQPVLGAAGEAHELFAHPESAARHGDDAASHDHGSPAGDHDGEDGERAPSLHLLLHFAHCCGGAVGLDVASYSPSAAVMVTAAPLSSLARHAASPPLPGPFRPPA